MGVLTDPVRVRSVAILGAEAVDYLEKVMPPRREPWTVEEVVETNSILKSTDPIYIEKPARVAQ